MKRQDIFTHATSEWVKYSQYEYQIKGGQEYLTPTADSQISIYNPLDVAEELVVDSLNLGALFCEEETLTDACKLKLLDFAQKYGLLGFMTSIPLNGNFYEYPEVFFGPNGYFDVDKMDTAEYMQYFKPFGIKEGQPRSGFELPPALIIGKTLEYELVFSRNYAERTDWLHGLFQEYYTHFAACLASVNAENPAIKNAAEGIVSAFLEYGLGFKMQVIGRPVMVWDFSALKMLLDTVYAFLVSQEDEPLRMCKHCSTVFFATHGRSEFCSARCRNQFNVYKSRNKL